MSGVGDPLNFMEQERKGPVEVLRSLREMLAEKRGERAGKLALMMEQSPEKLTSKTAWLLGGQVRESKRILDWLEDEAKEFL